MILGCERGEFNHSVAQGGYCSNDWYSQLYVDVVDNAPVIMYQLADGEISETDVKLVYVKKRLFRGYNVHKQFYDFNIYANNLSEVTVVPLIPGEVRSPVILTPCQTTIKSQKIKMEFENGLYKWSSESENGTVIYSDKDLGLLRDAYGSYCYFKPGHLLHNNCLVILRACGGSSILEDDTLNMVTVSPNKRVSPSQESAFKAKRVYCHRISENSSAHVTLSADFELAEFSLSTANGFWRSWSKSIQGSFTLPQPFSDAIGGKKYRGARIRLGCGHLSIEASGMKDIVFKNSECSSDVDMPALRPYCRITHERLFYNLDGNYCHLTESTGELNDIVFFRMSLQAMKVTDSQGRMHPIFNSDSSLWIGGLEIKRDRTNKYWEIYKGSCDSLKDAVASLNRDYCLNDITFCFNGGLVTVNKTEWAEIKMTKAAERDVLLTAHLRSKMIDFNLTDLLNSSVGSCERV